ncbi:arginine vasopressin receptor 2 [Klebsormidium nitens]|uniref:Arginine vasopressin receptor 2 n=1 Tax=Klebsormidium nitens TaxID=105231 RepID=A0A1Y1IRL9_KLENI|nr:arginine vasopressin receptor 2 [Klebsormidium nitens]|eukprot:GAQ92682.1 arginine vasopressin receptor 2 [Klebsormidium nitens]
MGARRAFLDTAIEGVEFEVELTDDKPIFAPRRRFSQYEHELLKAYCEEREAAKLTTRLKLPPGVKEPNCASTVMPRKKDAEGNWTERRICGDYLRHNDKTVPDKYPMPVADELFDEPGGSECFSTLNLRMGQQTASNHGSRRNARPQGGDPPLKAENR